MQGCISLTLTRLSMALCHAQIMSARGGRPSSMRFPSNSGEDAAASASDHSEAAFAVPIRANPHSGTLPELAPRRMLKQASSSKASQAATTANATAAASKPRARFVKQVSRLVALESASKAFGPARPRPAAVVAAAPEDPRSEWSSTDTDSDALDEAEERRRAKAVEAAAAAELHRDLYERKQPTASSISTPVVAKPASQQVAEAHARLAVSHSDALNRRAVRERARETFASIFRGPKNAAEWIATVDSRDERTRVRTSVISQEIRASASAATLSLPRLPLAHLLSSSSDPKTLATSASARLPHSVQARGRGPSAGAHSARLPGPHPYEDDGDDECAATPCSSLPAPALFSSASAALLQSYPSEHRYDLRLLQTMASDPSVRDLLAPQQPGASAFQALSHSASNLHISGSPSTRSLQLQEESQPQLHTSSSRRSLDPFAQLHRTSEPNYLQYDDDFAAEEEKDEVSFAQEGGGEIAGNNESSEQQPPRTRFQSVLSPSHSTASLRSTAGAAAGALSQSSSLTRLSLHGAYSASEFSQLLSLGLIHYLRRCEANHVPPISSVVAAVGSGSSAVHLKLSHLGLHAPAAQCIATLLRFNTTIQSVDLQGNGFGLAGVEELARGLMIGACEEDGSSLASRDPRDPAAREQAQGRGNKTLRALDLAHNSFDQGDSAATLVQLGQSGGVTWPRSLPTSALASSEASGESVPPAAAPLPPLLLSPLGLMLSFNSTLTSMRLSHCHLSDRHVVAFLPALGSQVHARVSGLTTLLLDSNAISDRGAACLAKMLASNDSLTRLDLTANCIRDAGGVALAEALGHNRTLLHLLLAKNGLASRSGLAFAAAIASDSFALHSLDLASNQIGGTDTWRKLMEALQVNQRIKYKGVEASPSPVAGDGSSNAVATMDAPPPLDASYSGLQLVNLSGNRLLSSDAEAIQQAQRKLQALHASMLALVQRPKVSSSSSRREPDSGPRSPAAGLSPRSSLRHQRGPPSSGTARTRAQQAAEAAGVSYLLPSSRKPAPPLATGKQQQPPQAQPPQPQQQRTRFQRLARPAPSKVKVLGPQATSVKGMPAAMGSVPASSKLGSQTDRSAQRSQPEVPIASAGSSTARVGPAAAPAPVRVLTAAQELAAKVQRNLREVEAAAEAATAQATAAAPETSSPISPSNTDSTCSVAAVAATPIAAPLVTLPPAASKPPSKPLHTKSSPSALSDDRPFVLSSSDFVKLARMRPADLEAEDSVSATSKLSLRSAPLSFKERQQQEAPLISFAPAANRYKKNEVLVIPADPATDGAPLLGGLQLQVDELPALLARVEEDRMLSRLARASKREAAHRREQQAKQDRIDAARAAALAIEHAKTKVMLGAEFLVEETLAAAAAAAEAEAKRKAALVEAAAAKLRKQKAERGVQPSDLFKILPKKERPGRIKKRPAAVKSEAMDSNTDAAATLALSAVTSAALAASASVNPAEDWPLHSAAELDSLDSYAPTPDSERSEVEEQQGTPRGASQRHSRRQSRRSSSLLLKRSSHGSSAAASPGASPLISPRQRSLIHLPSDLTTALEVEEQLDSVPLD